MTMKDVKRFTRMLLSARPKPFLWALGGSLPQSVRPSVYREVIFTLQKNGVPCVLDTDDEALKLGIEARPFMIKPNEFEMHRLMGREYKNIGEAVSGARQLAKRGIKIVIVSLGAKGAIFATEKEAFHLTTPKVPVTSKVGAGDSLIGGIVMGLSKKMRLKEAARLGIAASTSAVMREAPRLCLRKDILGLLPRIQERDF
jgi:1-phosphofructokinase